MSNNKKQIAFTGTDEYRDWVQDQARRHRLKVQQFLEKAVMAFVSLEHDGHPHPVKALPEDPAITAQSESEFRLVAKLLRILRDKHTLPRDVAVIEGFFDNYLRISKPSPADKRA